MPTEEPDLPYYLYVEKGSFTLTIYGKDENGEYTVVVAAYRIAHGGNKTPTGTFTLPGSSGRERWHQFPAGGWTQFATSYYPGLYLHSPMYFSPNPNDLDPRYYDGDKPIGSASSGGCLRMVTEAVRFIYYNCPAGTQLKIVNGSPLGTTSPPVPDRNGMLHDPTDIEAAPTPVLY